MRYEEKVCPLLEIAQAILERTFSDVSDIGAVHARCLGPKCAWFDDNAMECTVMVLATRFYEGR